ncbi:hypothetical protein Trydic_g3766 [Trypoxylus dichotomus]
MKILTPTTYDLCDPDDPEQVRTRVHSSDLTPSVAGSRGETLKAVVPRRRSGRPRKPTPSSFISHLSKLTSRRHLRVIDCPKIIPSLSRRRNDDGRSIFIQIPDPSATGYFASLFSDAGRGREVGNMISRRPKFRLPSVHHGDEKDEDFVLFYAPSAAAPSSGAHINQYPMKTEA